jgi:hypothetical protein
MDRRFDTERDSLIGELLQVIDSHAIARPGIMREDASSVTAFTGFDFWPVSVTAIYQQLANGRLALINDPTRLSPQIGLLGSSTHRKPGREIAGLLLRGFCPSRQGRRDSKAVVPN